MSDFEKELNGASNGSESPAIKKLSTAELGIPHREPADEAQSEAPEIANEDAAAYKNTTDEYADEQAAGAANDAFDTETADIEDDAPSYPLSYYRELKEKGIVPENANEGFIADKNKSDTFADSKEAGTANGAFGKDMAGADDDDAPSYPLSYYRELKEKGELPATKASEGSAAYKNTASEYADGQTAVAHNADSDNAAGADDDAPSYPLSYYRELKEKGELPVTKTIESPTAGKAAGTANDAFGKDMADAEDDDDAPSYPLSYYRELKQKAQEEALERELQAAYGGLAEPADIEGEQDPAPEAEVSETQAATSAAAKAPLFPVRGGAFGVQGIVEAAILIALTVIFGFLSYSVPILSFVAQLCFPLPMAILSMRRGLAMGICGTLAAGLLMVFIFNPLTAAILIIQTGLVGLAFGYCQRSGKKALTALVSGSLIASVGYAAALLLSTLVSGLELSTIFADIEELVSSYAVALQETGFYDTLAAQGIDPELYMESLADMMKLLLPAIITVSSIVLTVISYWLFGKLIKPLGYERAVLPRLRELHFSLHFVWGMIAGGFLMYFGFAKDMEILYNIGTNLLYIFGSLFLILGISVVSYILYIRRFSKTGRILIWLFVVMMMPYSLVLLVILGLFDPPLDIRKRIPAREE